MSVSIDTRKAHLVRQHGDITALYTWINDERSLVLIPTFRKSGWYVVCDSSAFKYDDDAYLMRQALIACDVMGFGDSPGTAFRIAKIIVEGLPDLVLMPPQPNDMVEAAVRELRKLGEMRCVDGDGNVIGHENVMAPSTAISTDFTV